MRLRAAAVLGVAIIALVLGSCDDGGGAGDAGNLFANPSFEDGEAPWVSLDSWGTHFAVSDSFARSGEHSALLQLRTEGAEGRLARVFGVVQEIAPEEFPEVLSGNYYVDRWEQGTPKQYLQFVVIAFNSENIPAEVASATNHQIRYILAGVDAQPIQISNARFVMVGSGAPKQGEWVHFERDIRRDFEELWGEAPRGFSRLRILFETRWDERAPTAPPSEADVYYDDLYVGPAPSQ